MQQVMLLLLLTGGVALSPNVLAQQVAPGADPPVSLNVEQATLNEVIQLLRNQVKLQFFYNAGLDTVSPRITLHLRQAPLSTALDKALAGTSLEYILRKGIVIIRPAAPRRTDSLLLMTGVVTNEQGAPLYKVSITGSRPNTGAYTNEAGQYRIAIPPYDTLHFSFLGYEPQQLLVNGRRQLFVRMKGKTSDISEVFVTGYQKMHKWEVTGAVSKIKGEELLMPGIDRIDLALQGRIPGVSVMMPSGGVGANPQIRIRGTATLHGNREPIWVVDGIVREDPSPFQGPHLTEKLSAADQAAMQAGLSIRGNSISGLNPADIEDITFLKDASATAIYGSRAANGVIVIRTKKGRQGPPSIQYRTDITVTDKPSYRRLNLMNSAERVALSKDLLDKAIINPGIESLETGYEGALYKLLRKEIDQQEFNKQVERLERTNTDWFDVLFRNSVSTNHHLSISGGTPALTYRGAVGYTRDAGNAKGNDMQRWSTMLRLDGRLNRSMDLGLNINMAEQETRGFYEGLNPYEYALATNRAISPDEYYFASIGALYQPEDFVRDTQRVRFNFLQEKAHTGNTNRNLALNAALNLGVQLARQLRYETVFAYGYETTKNQRRADGQSFATAIIRETDVAGGGPADGGIQHTDLIQKRSWTWRNTLSYNTELGPLQQHSLSLMAGTELRSTAYESESTQYYGPQAVPPGTDPLPPAFDEGRLVSNYFSLFSSAAYVYRRKYTISLNARTDASNRFADSRQRFNPIWSAGVRWDLLQESWMPRPRFVSGLALRVSYGYQGNTVETLPPYLTTMRVDPGSDPYTGNPYLAIGNLPDARLRWERTASANTGLDMALLNDKLQLSVDYYYKRSTDVISKQRAPQEYGVDGVYMNGSRITNIGWELALQWQAMNRGSWRWDIQLMAARNRNRLSGITYDPNQRSLVNGTALANGRPVGGLWSFPYAGLSPKDGQPMFRYLDVEPDPGRLKGNQATAYLLYTGSGEPEINGGLNTNLRYRQFFFAASFSVQLAYYRRLNPLAPAGQNGYFRPPAPDKNVSRELLHRWQQPGDEQHTDIPSIYSFYYIPEYYSVGDNFKDLSLSSNGAVLYRYTLYNYSNERTVNAGHLRCNFLSLGYSFREAQLRTLRHVQKLSVSFNVSNAFVIANKKLRGQDPEMIPVSASETSSVLPRYRTFSLNLNITM